MLINLRFNISLTTLTLFHIWFVNFWIKLVLCLVFIFRRAHELPSVLNTDCMWKPRQPTSIGKRHVFHIFSWHCSTNSWYFNRLRSWASSALSSYGTVSSITILSFSFLTTPLCLVVDSWLLYATGTLVACLRQSAFANHYLLPETLLPQF